MSKFSSSPKNQKQSDHSNLLNEDVTQLIKKGKKLSKAGKWQEASSIFEKLLAVEPENTKIIIIYAKVMQKANQIQKACQVYETALRVSPDCI
ncbi:MAG: tetratricopeptide repeat protein, partial [Jaaginema sp. PMC 1079.18]|nr:tetratricopeptide repeat protein [Jaaginema sp. PMC 1079.18]